MPRWLACSIGSFFAIAVNNSLTFSAVLALVSKKSRLASRAYASASAVGTARLSGCSATKSALFPASAMMMFSFAWRCSSLTQALALSSELYSASQLLMPLCMPWSMPLSYRLCDVVYNYRAVCVPVVHGRQ